MINTTTTYAPPYGEGQKGTQTGGTPTRTGGGGGSGSGSGGGSGSGTSTQTQQPTKTYFGYPQGPFAPPGIYITPNGPITYGGGQAYKPGVDVGGVKTYVPGYSGGGSGGGYQNPTVATQQNQVQFKQQVNLQPQILQQLQQQKAQQEYLQKQGFIYTRDIIPTFKVEEKPKKERQTTTYIDENGVKRVGYVEFQPAKEGSLGLGGKVVVKDEKGNIVAEEMKVEKASEKQPELTFKKDVLGKSGVYMALPYASQEIVKGLRKIPGFEKVEKKLGFNKPTKEFLGDIGVPYADTIGGTIEGTVTLAPLAIFTPLITTGVEGLRTTKTYPGKTDVTYKEVQVQQLTTTGEIKNLGAYKITSKTAPPQVEFNTQYGKIVGAEPIKTEWGKTKVSMTKTTGLTEVGKDFTVIEMTPRTKSISVISGTGEPINIQKLYPGRLSKIDKVITERLAGNVPEKLTLNMFSKDLEFIKGELEQTKYYKGSRKSEFTSKELMKGFQPEGKRITRTTYISQAKEIPLPVESKFEIYKGKMVYKDITKPFARATGEFGEMTGTTIRLKEPVNAPSKVINLDKYTVEPVELKANLLKYKETISVYHATDIKNVPSILEKGLIPGEAKGVISTGEKKVFTAIARKTAEGYKAMGKDRVILEIKVPKEKFFEAVRKEGVGTIGQVKFDYVPKDWIRLETKQQLRTLPKISPRSSPIRIPVEIRNFMKGKSIVKEISKPSKSIYYGTAYGGMVSKKQLVEDFGISRNKNLYVPGKSDLNISRESQIYYPSEKSIMSERELTKSVNLPREKSIERVKEISMEKPMTKILEREKIVYKQMQREMLRSLQREKYAQKQQGRSGRGFSFRLKEPIKKKTPFKFSLKSEKDFDTSMRGFDVFVIKKGKRQVVAKGLSKGSALDIGAREIFGSLKASFGISKSDLGIRDIQTGGEFAKYYGALRRPVSRSRLNKFGDVYVQKSTISMGGLGRGRLTTIQERRAITESRINKMMRYLK